MLGISAILLVNPPASLHSATPFVKVGETTQRGFSLLEVMLSCALGLFLIGGLIQVYLATQKTFELQSSLVTIQENARFATHFLQQNIRMAGYSGCGSAPPFTNNALALQGYQNELPPFLAGEVARGSDSILIGRCQKEKGEEYFEQTAFFIGATSRKNSMGGTVYALFEKPKDGSKRELVSDVTGMRINYGIATLYGKDILSYLPAEKIENWNAVRAVEIALLLTSEFPILPHPETYEFAGVDLPFSRFLRREWDVYTTLRD